ncbi:TPA: YSIRK-type signal peptide-containing protein, partial [Staphylococcus aureus]|nr:YSIRK-type signal peptide-containing protein [Staphylococcus aureus]
MISPVFMRITRFLCYFLKKNKYSIRKYKVG